MLKQEHIPARDRDLAANAGAARHELERVLASKAFAASERLRNFLRYVTEFALAHPGTPLKEVQIGTELYRIAEYDPKTAATVRVDAGRLRQKLLAYYTGEGAANPAKLELPPGSYLPTLRVTAPPLPAAVPVTRRRAWWILLAVAIILVAGGAYLTLRRPDAGASAIALLPVSNRSGDSSVDGVAQNLTRTLAQRLSREAGTVVIPLIEAGDQARRGQTPDSMLRRLRGSVLLESSLTRRGNTYRASLRALDLDRGLQLWSGLVEAPREKLADRTIALIRRNIDNRSAAPSASQAPEANRLYSEARYRRILEAEGSLDTSEKLLRRAVQVDPSFADAWALLADTVLRRAEKAGRTRRQDYLEAAALCRKALSADRSHLLALETIGNIALYHAWNFDEAVQALSAVVSLEPDNQRARRQLAEALTLSGRSDDALRVIEAARSEGAFAQYLDLQRVLTLQAGGNTATTLEQARALVNRYRSFHLAHWAFGNALRAVGNPEAAAAEFRECLRLTADSELRCRVSLAVVEARAGRPAEVDRLLSNFATVESEQGFGAGVIRAILLTSIDRHDEALRALLSAADRGDPDLSFAWLEPQLEALRRHPGFRAVSKWVPPPR